MILILEKYLPANNIWTHSYVESKEQNKLTNKIETEAWTHGTDWQPSEGREQIETGWKKGKGLAKEYRCMTLRHRQQCGDGQTEGRAAAVWRQAKAGKMGTYVIVSTLKMKKKKSTCHLSTNCREWYLHQSS